jgi:hypothetical protein
MSSPFVHSLGMFSLQQGASGLLLLHYLMQGASAVRVFCVVVSFAVPRDVPYFLRLRAMYAFLRLCAHFLRLRAMYRFFCGSAARCEEGL